MKPSLFKSAEEQKLDIQIAFTNGNATYITGDVVEGVAKITAIAPMRFDKINIEFIGTARTYNDCNISAVATKQRPEAAHRFLKLLQPDLSTYYPADLILRAGQTCHVPFRFTAPEKLLSGICSHRDQNAAAPESHLSLPPSLGDNNGKDLPIIADDMAPLMSRIRYETIVQVTKANSEVVATKSKAVRIVPAAIQKPSINAAEEKQYITRQEKSIKKRMSKAKCGALVIEAAQAHPTLVRSALHADAEQTTLVPVTLRFDPENDKCTPPDLRNLVAELQATTRFTTHIRNIMPTHDGRSVDPYQGTYSEKVKLTSSYNAGADWIMHRSNSNETPQPSANYHGGAYYTAHLRIPVTLPSNKTFVPPFHSCLISRVYTLSLTLNMNTAGAQTSMNLKLPFHIAASSSLDRYSDAKSDLWALVEDDEEYGTDLPPNYLDISDLKKFLPKVSVVEC